MYKTLVLSFFSLFLFSCATKSVVQETQGEIEELSLLSFKEGYQNEMQTFDFLKIKGKVATDSKRASIRLYLEDQKRIWANISLFGITGARANITADKVQAYEVLEKRFVDSDFAYFNNKFNISFIDFNKLQALLTGRLFLIGSWSDYRLETKDRRYVLHNKNNDALLITPVEGEYLHSFYLDADYRLTKVDIQDTFNHTNIIVTYNNWVEVNNIPLPSDVKVIIKGDKEQVIDLNYNSFIQEKDNPPFNIPNGYNEIDL